MDVADRRWVGRRGRAGHGVVRRRLVRLDADLADGKRPAAVRHDVVRRDVAHPGAAHPGGTRRRAVSLVAARGRARPDPARLARVPDPVPRPADRRRAAGQPRLTSAMRCQR